MFSLFTDVAIVFEDSVPHEFPSPMHMLSTEISPRYRTISALTGVFKGNIHFGTYSRIKCDMHDDLTLS
uniref:Uncharacterized protein n=1 Tax=Arundo donax TaxID=35708 RepID=A0A0A9LEK3_ARUDO